MYDKPTRMSIKAMSANIATQNILIIVENKGGTGCDAKKKVASNYSLAALLKL